LKAAVFYGPKDMRIEEVRKPIVRDDSEVLVAVKACAICGTDVRIFNNGHRAITPPQIIGHEISGIVEDTGKKVKNIRKGDKVIVTVEIGCGHCRFCVAGKVNLCVNRRSIGYFYPGGFAEYILVPKEAVLQGNVIKLKDDVNLDEMTLVEPLANCISAHESINISFGDIVLIIGTGPIGDMHIELSRLRGAGKIIVTDLSEGRIKLAKRFGADYYFVSSQVNIKERVNKITNGKGADAVIVACSSADAQKLALDLVGTKGRVCYFGGLPEGIFLDKFDSNIIHYKEVTLTGSFSSSNHHSHIAIGLMENRRISVSKYITHKFTLDEIVKGFNAIMNGEAIKVIINP